MQIKFDIDEHYGKDILIRVKENTFNIDFDNVREILLVHGNNQTTILIQSYALQSMMISAGLFSFNLAKSLYLKDISLTNLNGFQQSLIQMSDISIVTMEEIIVDNCNIGKNLI